MQISPEQQKAIEQQKANCIFCQIISGKIPAKKVYENKTIIAILDINPASNGHVLLMPKEHYPIMPLIPPDIFKELFLKAKKIDLCIKDALLCKETTIFVANGAAAGQQSSHFMMHIIPRDVKDGLENLDCEGKIDESKQEVYQKIGEALKQTLTKNIYLLGYTKNDPETQINIEQLEKIIETTPQLKEMILKQPEQFKYLTKTNPQMIKMFTKISVDEFIDKTTQKFKQQKTPEK